MGHPISDQLTPYRTNILGPTSLFSAFSQVQIFCTVLIRPLKSKAQATCNFLLDPIVGNVWFLKSWNIQSYEEIAKKEPTLKMIFFLMSITKNQFWIRFDLPLLLQMLSMFFHFQLSNKYLNTWRVIYFLILLITQDTFSGADVLDAPS